MISSGCHVAALALPPAGGKAARGHPAGKHIREELNGDPSRPFPPQYGTLSGILSHSSKTAWASGRSTSITIGMVRSGIGRAISR